MSVKDAPPKKKSIKMRPIIRRDWEEARKGVNDG